MSNEKLNQNSTIVINADNEKLILLKQFLDQNNISEEILKTVIKKQSHDKFNYIDDTKTTATCNACDNEFIIADIPSEFIDICQKQGICSHCASIFAQANTLHNTLKSKHISTRNSRIINGGKNVGSRLKIMFNDAIASPNFNEEILANFLDNTYSNQILKFSSYSFCVDVTDVDEVEIKENRNFYKRYYSRVYEVCGHKIKLCSQIFDRQFEACKKEFIKLNLINEENEY